MSEYIQVATTVEQRADAEKLATLLVEKRLAACAQILGPISSYFHWQGRIDQAEEYLCLLKSRQDLFGELEKAIIVNHPYEVPEIVATPLSGVGTAYQNWLARELK